MPKASRWTIDGFAPVWVVIPLLLFPLALVVSSSNDAIQFAPAHGSTTALCAAGALLFAVAWTWIGARWSPPSPREERRGGVAGLLLFAFGGMMVLSLACAHVVQGMIDFPAATTRTYVAMLPIDRAYHSTGRGSHWTIVIGGQRIPITPEDYRAMLANRRPDDSADPNNIASAGTFCAQVMVQQSGDALRMLHGKLRALGAGTLTFCPPGSAAAAKS
jgi:hypothetical protein